MKKLVAEDLFEYDKLQINKEQLNESISDQFDKLDKTNDAAIRKFTFELAKKKYITIAGANNDAAIKLIKLLCEKADISKLLEFLEKAAKNNFKGTVVFKYANPEAKTGRALYWMPPKGEMTQPAKPKNECNK